MNENKTFTRGGWLRSQLPIIHVDGLLVTLIGVGSLTTWNECREKAIRMSSMLIFESFDFRKYSYHTFSFWGKHTFTHSRFPLRSRRRPPKLLNTCLLASPSLNKNTWMTGLPAQVSPFGFASHPAVPLCWLPSHRMQNGHSTKNETGG